MAIGATEGTKNKRRLRKAQKIVLNPNPDSATFKPGHAQCWVPARLPPPPLRHGDGPPSPPCNAARSGELPTAQVQRLPQPWSTTEPPRLPGPPREQMHNSSEPHGAVVSTETSVFFSKTPKNPPIPGAFPTSCAASHLHTKKPGQLGSPRQIRHRKISWALSCHVSSCPNHNKKPHKQWSKLQ